jgi:hypothetical protein
VSILVDQLSEIGNSKSNEFSRWSGTTDTIMGRLIEIGQPAVPRLLAALDGNDRMTRSQPMMMSGPMKQLPKFLSVKTIVRDILSQMAFNNGSVMSDDELRKYWQRNLGKSEFQRSYDILLDDSASQKWKYAALALLQSDSKSNPYLRYQIGKSIDIQKISVRPEMRKALGQSNPSVSDLILKRLSVPYEKLNLYGSEREKSEQLLSLALTSYYIRPDRSLASLKLASKRFLDCLSNPKVKEDVFEDSYFEPVIEVRKKLGDESYLSDLSAYADFLRSTESRYRLYASNYFIERLNDPSVARLAKSVFFDSESHYSIRGLAKSKPLFVGVIASELLGLAEGRAEATALLDNSSAIDSKIVEGNTNRRAVFSDDGQYLREEPAHAYEAIRICDLVAHALQRVRGCPEFRLDWSIDRRDKARQKIKTFVNQLGSKKLVFKDRNWLYPISF